MDCVCCWNDRLGIRGVQMINLSALILGIGAVQLCYFVFQAAAFVLEQPWPWQMLSASVASDVFGGFLIFVGCAIASAALFQMHHILRHNGGHKCQNINE